MTLNKPTLTCYYLEWRPIQDCNNPALAITTDDSNVGSKLSTKHFTGATNQMWSLDSEGRLVNQETGFVIQANTGGPTMQQPTPLTGDKEWKYRNDIRSSQETDVETVYKIVNDGKNCLNTANRFLSQGSAIILYPAKAVHPGNACWKF